MCIRLLQVEQSVNSLDFLLNGPTVAKCFHYLENLSRLWGVRTMLESVFWMWQVEPISISGASVLSSTTRADGFVIIPEDLEGYARNAEVTVYLYE